MHFATAIFFSFCSQNFAEDEPFTRSSRLLIVGAGPAGVHMASHLKHLGYTDITILERTHRVGGKSYSLYRDETGECEQKRDGMTGVVDTTTCIAHEMGTCFLHNGYRRVRDLLQKYGLTPEIAPEGRAMFSRYAEDQFDSQGLNDFVTSAIMAGVADGSIKRSWWIPSFAKTLTVMDALLKAVSKYNKLHKDIFGEIEFSMPERLSKDALGKIDKTFFDFLQDNDLHALAAFLMFAHAAQGYGYVKSIPAFYGLLWISPELLSGYVQMSMHQQIEEVKLLAEASSSPPMMELLRALTSLFVGGDADQVYRTTTMLPEGYGKLWQTIHTKDGLSVRFGVEIGQIDRQLSDKAAGVKVTFRQDGGSWQTEEYDFLLYTAPFAHASTYVKDLTLVETSIFTKLKSFVLTTTLYTSDAVKGYSEPSVGAPIMYNADKMDNNTMDGSWYADRNDPHIFADTQKLHNQARVGYQFFENFCEFDQALCDTDRTPDSQPSQRFAEAPKVLQKFKDELEAQQVKNVQIIEQFPWPYFHHFRQEAINAGMPWDLFEMQGTQKTWWLGSSAIFESVHDVINYNLMILKRYLPSSRVVHLQNASIPATSGIVTLV